MYLDIGSIGADPLLSKGCAAVDRLRGTSSPEYSKVEDVMSGARRNMAEWSLSDVRGS